MSPTTLSHIQDSIASFSREVEQNLEKWRGARGPESFLDVEVEVHKFAVNLADTVTKYLLQGILSDIKFQIEATAAVKNSRGDLRDGGARDVQIRLLGGSSIRVKVPYLKPRTTQRKRGRRRKSGNRGKGGVGLYPTLVALGIWIGVTPALAMEIVEQMSSSESHQAAFDSLGRHHISFNTKVIRRIFYYFANRMAKQRKSWVEEINLSGVRQKGPLSGKRVVVGTDGGRIRIRQPARCGRRRKKTRHRSFKAPWKEPKVLVIYVINEQGYICDSFHPILDATMGDCDKVFEMIAAYLMALGASESSQIIFVSDGAPWIWNRIPYLSKSLGIDAVRIIEVVDFYHAAKALYDIADIPHWNAKERGKWVKIAKKLLNQGHIEALINHIKTLARGRRAKAISEHIGYFKRHSSRMRYQWFRAKKIPIGSGAVESAVRRIINLRLKGNAKFWLLNNTDGMLLVRSYLKAGRLEQLFTWSLHQAASWWCIPSPGPVFAWSAPVTVAPEEEFRGPLRQAS